MANRYYFSDGNTVEVYSENVTLNNAYLSGVAYYYNKGRGYGCRDEREVAKRHHDNYAEGKAKITKVVPIDDFGKELKTV